MLVGVLLFFGLLVVFSFTASQKMADYRRSLRYTCPCCGFIVFTQPPGSYEACPVCQWQDDAAQLEFATTCADEPNGRTLYDAQRAVVPSKLASRYERDPTWRPIDRAIDRFEDFDGPRDRRAPDEE